ncbi:MAG: hypothetical protein MRY57_00850, partial [Candidatus Pacebacteria bacterium]|nr:hypothetical protein [Candidatus Paceibacterota bacterium]
MNKKSLKFYIFLVIVGVIIGIQNTNVSAQSISELEREIEARSEERENLEKEAARIREELTKVGAEKGSLTKELNRINAERKDLDNTIKKTQNTIDSLGLTINKNSQEISRYNSEIEGYAGTIAGLLRGIDQFNNLTLLEIISSQGDLSEVLMVRDSYARLQTPLVELTDDLNSKKLALRKTSLELEKQQLELADEKDILDDQRSIVREKEQEQAEILSETEKKESSVRNNLNSTLATIAALDKEIRDFESKLEFALNPNSIPEKGSAVFDWPLESVLITQRFGRTVSSQRLYVSGSHSGMDFRA